MEDKEISKYEFLARNIYYTSQYSNATGIKKNFLYPNYKKESYDYPGRHRCRVSVQRLCDGKWEGLSASAMKTKSPKQQLMGFSIAPARIVEDHGFILEPAAHAGNPYHAHIVIPELDLPFPTSEEKLGIIMNSGLKRRLDSLSEEFEFIPLDNLGDTEANCYYSSTCLSCLREGKSPDPD